MDNDKFAAPTGRILYRIGFVAVILAVIALLGGVWLLGRFGADRAVGYADDIDLARAAGTFCR